MPESYKENEPMEADSWEDLSNGPSADIEPEPASSESEPAESEITDSLPEEQTETDSEQASAQQEKGYDQGQERIYALGLDQIENHQILSSIDTEGFKLNYERTVKYLKMVIEKSNDSANKERAEKLLASELEIGEKMGL